MNKHLILTWNLNIAHFANVFMSSKFAKLFQSPHRNVMAKDCILQFDMNIFILIFPCHSSITFGLVLLSDVEMPV